MNSSTCDVTRALVPAAAAGNEPEGRSWVTDPSRLIRFQVCLWFISGVPLAHATSMMAARALVFVYV